MRARLGAAVVAAMLLAGGLVAALPAAPAAVAAPVSPGDVTSYLGGGGHESFNAAETQINATTAPSLTKQWTASSAGGAYIASQPIVAGGVVYWGDENGFEHATNATTGAELWSTFLGTSGLLDTNPQVCGPTVLGVEDAATIATVGGRQLVFVGGGGDVDGPQGNGLYEYALDPADGSVVWQRLIGFGPTPSDHSDGTFHSDTLWASPQVLGDTVYVAIAAHGSCPHHTLSRLVQMSGTTGTIENVLQINTSLPGTAGDGGCLGGGIWGTPTIDVATGMMYVTTGDADASCPEPEIWASAILRVRLSDLTVVDHWSAPVDESADFDFGTTPVLFSGQVGGVSTPLVGAVSKDGIYYVWNRMNLGAGPVWQLQAGVGSDFGPKAPAEWDGATLYVGEQAPLPGSQCDGSGTTLQALDPGTGTAKWVDCFPGSVLYGAPEGAPGIIAFNVGTQVEIINSANGAVLWTFTNPDSSSFWGPPTISNGWLYTANSDGNLYAFTTPTTPPPPPPPPPPVPPVPANGSYRLVASDGGVFDFGSAKFLGSTGAVHLKAPIVGMAATPSGDGYRLVASDGGVFDFGSAKFLGSTGAVHLKAPIVGMAATPSGDGYWLVASDGGVFSFGDAAFLGSTGAVHLKAPIVGMAATPSGDGYWLVASDGGVFSFGDAAFLGSTGAVHLKAPIVGMAATPSGDGYWLVASDGGVFSFGDAAFLGSTGAVHLKAPIVGMAATPSGNGYWLVASDGGVFSFGDAAFLGSTGNVHLNAPIVAIAP